MSASYPAQEMYPPSMNSTAMYQLSNDQQQLPMVLSAAPRAVALPMVGVPGVGHLENNPFLNTIGGSAQQQQQQLIVEEFPARHQQQMQNVRVHNEELIGHPQQANNSSQQTQSAQQQQLARRSYSTDLDSDLSELDAHLERLNRLTSSLTAGLKGLQKEQQQQHPGSAVPHQPTYTGAGGGGERRLAVLERERQDVHQTTGLYSNSNKVVRNTSTSIPGRRPPLVKSLSLVDTDADPSSSATYARLWNKSYGPQQDSNSVSVNNRWSGGGCSSSSSRNTALDDMSLLLLRQEPGGGCSSSSYETSCNRPNASIRDNKSGSLTDIPRTWCSSLNKYGTSSCSSSGGNEHTTATASVSRLFSASDSTAAARSSSCAPGSMHGCCPSPGSGTRVPLAQQLTSISKTNNPLHIGPAAGSDNSFTAATISKENQSSNSPGAAASAGQQLHHLLLHHHHHHHHLLQRPSGEALADATAAAGSTAEINRLMAKIEQDNKLLAELDQARPILGKRPFLACPSALSAMAGRR